MRFTPTAEYAFHHPLIRAVAYESQLKSDRAELHRRLAAAIEAREPESAEENAALIAEHLEAAGDLHAAYGWHMRAATWATNRDIAAARLSWERARTIADALPAEDPSRTAMRIAPRTMLCGIAWRVHVNVAGDRFEELRQLCTAAGDKASLAIAMAGLVIGSRVSGPDARGVAAGIGSLGPHRVDRRSDLDGGAVLPGDLRQGSRAASGVTCCGGHRRVIDLADGDPSKGNFIDRVSVSARLYDAGYGPLLPGSSRMARRPAARPGHGPQRRPRVLRRGCRLCLLAGNTVWRADGPTIARCARSRMRCGSPNDPVTIRRRWSSPG